MNAVDLVRIARRHGIAIVADPFDPGSAGYTHTKVEAMGGADVRGLPEDPEVVDFKAAFPGLAGELRWLLDAGLIDSCPTGEPAREQRLDDAPSRRLVDLDELDGLGGFYGPEAA